MRPTNYTLSFPTLLVILSIASSPLLSAQQTPASPNTESKGSVILLELSQPLFPQMARIANVEGEVDVNVIVQPDGRTEAFVTDGHPLLRQSALDSARHSRFECRLCTAPLSYQLVYVFKRVDGDCCNAVSGPVGVEQEPESYDQQGRPRTRVVITVDRFCTCDPGGELRRKSRSLKCLYLWKCAMR